MSPTERPKLAIPSLHSMSTAEPAPELPHHLERSSAPPPPQRVLHDWPMPPQDVAEELEREPKKPPRPRKPAKHNTGSIADPYVCADDTKKVKTALNFTEGFAADFHLFAAQYLRTSSKSAWAERVLLREIQKTRKRGSKPAG